MVVSVKRTTEAPFGGVEVTTREMERFLISREPSSETTNSGLPPAEFMVAISATITSDPDSIPTSPPALMGEEFSMLGVTRAVVEAVRLMIPSGSPQMIDLAVALSVESDS